MASTFPEFSTVVAALHHGDFTKLDVLFTQPPTPSAPLVTWIAQDRFATEAGALNEALACACFNGRTGWVLYLLDHGADLLAGSETGLTGLHWATNRGQLDTVRLLLARDAPLETRNCYGGTVLGGTVWAAVHEPRPTHRAIIEALLEAGAKVEEAEYPSGDREIDEVLERFRGQSRQGRQGASST